MVGLLVAIRCNLSTYVPAAFAGSLDVRCRLMHRACRRGLLLFFGLRHARLLAFGFQVFATAPGARASPIPVPPVGGCETENKSSSVGYPIFGHEACCFDRKPIHLPLAFDDSLLLFRLGLHSPPLWYVSIYMRNVSRKPKLIRKIAEWLAKVDAGGPAAPIDQGARGTLGHELNAVNMSYVCVGGLVCWLVLYEATAVGFGVLLLDVPSFRRNKHGVEKIESKA